MGAAAAVNGGFTSVVTMPNTDPPLDNTSNIAFQYLQGQKAGKVRLILLAMKEVAKVSRPARSGQRGD